MIFPPDELTIPGSCGACTLHLEEHLGLGLYWDSTKASLSWIHLQKYVYEQQYDTSDHITSQLRYTT